MRKVTSLLSVLALGMFLFVSCQPEANKIPPCNNGILDGDETSIDCGGPDCLPCVETCYDGIQNQGEEGVDCGGPCPLPCATCFDGIQNGNETGIDCGGPDCPACPPSCNDLIMNGGEDGVDCGGNCLSCAPVLSNFAATIDGSPMVTPSTNATMVNGSLNVTGSASGYQISLTFASDIIAGSYEILAAGSVVATLNNGSVNPPLFSGTSGNLTITTHNLATKSMSGTFSFSADNGVATAEVTDGSFSLTY